MRGKNKAREGKEGDGTRLTSDDGSRVASASGIDRSRLSEGDLVASVLVIVEEQDEGRASDCEYKASAATATRQNEEK